MLSVEETNYGKRGLGPIKKIQTYKGWVLAVAVDRMFKNILMMIILVMLYDNELEFDPAQKSMKVDATVFVIKLAYFCVLLMCLSMITVRTTIKCFYMHLFAHGCVKVKRLVMEYSSISDKAISWTLVLANAILTVMLFQHIPGVISGFCAALVFGSILGLWIFHETVVVMIPLKKTTSDVGIQTSLVITRVARRGTLPITTADLNV